MTFPTRLIRRWHDAFVTRQESEDERVQAADWAPCRPPPCCCLTSAVESCPAYFQSFGQRLPEQRLVFGAHACSSDGIDVP